MICLFIRPWSKESERILHDLCKDKISITNNNDIARIFGMKYKSLFRNGYLDVATTRYSKRMNNKTFFIIPPEVLIEKKGKNYHFTRSKPS